jgi:hypothetical protein
VRRVINYNSLPHNRYRFARGFGWRPGQRAIYGFEVLPRFYETAWFRAPCARAGLRRPSTNGVAADPVAVRAGVEERGRLAREIHDTLGRLVGTRNWMRGHVHAGRYVSRATLFSIWRAGLPGTARRKSGAR